MGIDTIKRIVIYTIIVSVFGTGIKLIYDKINRLNRDNERLTRNLNILNNDIEINSTSNDELIYSVEELTVKSNELRRINKRLNEEIKDMKLVVKKLQSVSKINTKISQKIDTVNIIPSLDNINDLSFKYEDKYTKINGEINIPNEYLYDILKTDNHKLNVDLMEKFDLVGKQLTEDKVPYIHNLKYEIDSNLTIAEEYKYKRRWLFWKRIVGVKIHIKSENPNLSIDTIKAYQILK